MPSVLPAPAAACKSSRISQSPSHCAVIGLFRTKGHKKRVRECKVESRSGSIVGLSLQREGETDKQNQKKKTMQTSQ